MLEVLTFAFFVEVGWIPDQGVILPESDQGIENLFYLDMDAYVQWWILWIRGGMKTYSWPAGWGTGVPCYWPARIDYRFSFGLTYSILTVGLRHLCSHSVNPYGRITDPVDGWYDEIFFRIEAEVRGRECKIE